jgi:hypothetical protein
MNRINSKSETVNRESQMVAALKQRKSFTHAASPSQIAANNCN